MSTQYRPSEYHAGLKWDQEQEGKVIITPFQPYPTTEYHKRQKLEQHYQEKHEAGKKKGW